MSRPTWSVRLDVLDQQLLDADGRPVGRIDEVELDDATGDVVALRTGGGALGPRIGGLTGAALARATAALTVPFASISPADVAEWRPLPRLRQRLADLPDVAPLERWLGRHVVGRVPGAGDADA